MVFIGYAYNGRSDFFTLERRLTPYIWDGASMRTYHANYDKHLTDFTANSPQVGAMNQVMEKEWFQQVKPKCFWELSTWWDPKWVEKMQNHGESAGTLSPRRYLGFVKWVMWLPKPRVVRDFTGWTTLRDKHWPVFEQVVTAVDEIQNHAILGEFWQHGQLVPNEGVENPIHADIVDPTGVVPEDIKNTDFYHFFALETNLDPERRLGRGRDVYQEAGAIEQQSAFRVFVMAHVLGDATERRWLVYGHAPRGDEADVKVKVPGFGRITINVDQAGSYYVVSEKEKSVRPAF
jgi:hypothetical protein